jgi:N-glycosylase/DNA lyase
VFNRWIEQSPNEFIGVLGPYVVRLQHQNDNLRYTFLTDICNNKDLIDSSNDNDRRVESALVLHNYFQLTVKLSELYDRWCRSDVRFEKGQIPMGIRVLAQEPLENLLSFICSSNNNVQRISKMIKGLCDEYGKQIGTLNGINYHQFPTLGILFDD